MAKTLGAAGSSYNLTSGLTRFIAYNQLFVDPTESNIQFTIRTAGTFYDFKIYVSANTLNGTATYRLRKDTGSGPGDGNQVIAVATTLTGLFEDTTNNDAYSAGDKFSYSAVTGGSSGSVTVQNHSLAFDSGTNTSQRYSTARNPVSAAVATIYSPLTTQCPNDAVTEANAQFKFRTGGTLKNGFWNIITNTQSGAITARTRIDGANGNIAIAVTASTTGIFEDTSNTDTISSTNLVNWSISGWDAVNTFVGRSLAVDFETTDSTFELISGSSANTGNNISASTTRYIGAGLPSSSATATEANAQIKSSFAFTASNLGIYIVSNAGTTEGTFNLRIGGSNTAITTAITALTTGYFEDTSNSVSVALGDLINTRIITGATGVTAIANAGFMGEAASSNVTTISRMMLMGIS